MHSNFSNQLPDWLVQSKAQQPHYSQASSGTAQASPDDALSPVDVRQMANSLITSSGTSKSTISPLANPIPLTLGSKTRKLCRKARELVIKHSYLEALAQLKEARRLVRNTVPRLQMEVLEQIASVYSEHADKLLSARKLRLAYQEYKKALETFDKLTSLKGGCLSEALRMMKVNCVFGLSVCCELDGRIEEAIAVLTDYINLLSSMPQTEQKRKAAEIRKSDLEKQLPRP